MSLPLSVIDPALGAAEGHHAGFAAMVAASRPRSRQVTLWTHRGLADRDADRLREQSVGVQPVFATNYYRHFDKPGDPAVLFGYIGGLAREYAAAHRRIASDGGRHRLLYHTVSWEHANALALAIQLETYGTRLEHCVLLMFNPGIGHDGRTTDPKRRLNYRMAFGKLHRLPGVRLFAGCSEHAESYARLLELAMSLPVHPCLMASWQEPRPAKTTSTLIPLAPRERVGVRGSKTNSLRFLLYLGDAKTNKRFNALPETIGKLQTQCGPNARFVVQYNQLPDWADPILRTTERQLKALAETEPRLELHQGFWPDDELHRQLAAADLLVLNYDAREYADKSSGLVWLAAWHNLPTLLPTGWPSREAKRIGLPHAPRRAIDDLSRLSEQLTVENDDPGYRHTLFTPLWDWLEEAGVSVPSPSVRRSG